MFSCTNVCRWMCRNCKEKSQGVTYISNQWAWVQKHACSVVERRKDARGHLSCGGYFHFFLGRKELKFPWKVRLENVQVRGIQRRVLWCTLWRVPRQSCRHLSPWHWQTESNINKIERKGADNSRECLQHEYSGLLWNLHVSIQAIDNHETSHWHRRIRFYQHRDGVEGTAHRRGFWNGRCDEDGRLDGAHSPECSVPIPCLAVVKVHLHKRRTISPRRSPWTILSRHCIHIHKRHK